MRTESKCLAKIYLRPDWSLAALSTSPQNYGLVCRHSRAWDETPFGNNSFIKNFYYTSFLKLSSLCRRLILLHLIIWVDQVIIITALAAYLAQSFLIIIALNQVVTVTVASCPFRRLFTAVCLFTFAVDCLPWARVQIRLVRTFLLYI